MMKINDLFDNPGADPVCIRRNELITYAQMIGTVKAISCQVQKYEVENWILAANDTYYFLCGFLALLCSGKEILLPPNNQSGTLRDVIVGAEALMTDLDIATAWPTIRLDQLHAQKTANIDLHIPVENSFLQLCTSGSTGEPKQIRKSLMTLLLEINCLEQTWGQQIQKRLFASTVSHQHIYGLLFRVLWPLLTGRKFMCENIEYPEQLAYVTQRYGDIVLISSPAYLKRMIDVFSDGQFSYRIKTIFSSGGPLAEETAIAYTQKMQVTPIEVLGSTETGGVAYRQQVSQGENAWRKFMPVQLRCAEDINLLEVCSPFCYTSDWYRMGDTVEMLDEERFRLSGRVDRIIKLEEKRISLDAMERQLLRHPLLDDVRVVVLDGYRTVLGAVCILSPEGQKQLEAELPRAISNHLKEYLADYFDRVTLPRKWRYVTEFPYNSQGKLTQNDLRQLFTEKNND